jgi:hypothetical protein
MFLDAILDLRWCGARKVVKKEVEMAVSTVRAKSFLAHRNYLGHEENASLSTSCQNVRVCSSDFSGAS